MPNRFPDVGCWYKEIQQNILFEVVAIDERNLTIETQLLDGEISEYDFDSWDELIIEQVEEPEDWRNPFELSGEDKLDPDLPMHPESWSSPLSEIEPLYMHGVEDF